LLEWLPNAANKRDQRALLNRAQALMAELESAMNELKQLE
jgi:DNA-binding ferritin-like protein (Dps family)